MSKATSSGLAPLGRRGFALPLAILALALVTAAVAASNLATRAEIVANQGVRSQDRAYQLAEAGLQQFVARHGEAGFCDHCVADPSTSQYKTDTTEMTRVGAVQGLVGGYADVISVRVRPKVLGDSVALFLLYSKGVDTTVKMITSAGVTVYSERTVAQYASFRSGFLRPVAAWASLNGLTKYTNGSSLNGATASSCTGPDAPAGLAVPTGEYYKTNAGYSDPSSTITSPFATLKASLGIDWDAIINHNAIPADYTDSWPPIPSSWYVIRMTGTLTQPSQNYNGILIAEGDVKLANGRDFDGIVLAGGHIYASGSNESAGAFVSGLKYLLPGAAAPASGIADNDSLGGNKPFRYSYCNISRAMGLLDTYYPWSNTWLDNVAVW
jgi:hypothetical protein